MYFDTKNYADAILQLAKALIELNVKDVNVLFDEDEYLLMHDLYETIGELNPAFSDKLMKLASEPA